MAASLWRMNFRRFTGAALAATALGGGAVCILWGAAVWGHTGPKPMITDTIPLPNIPKRTFRVTDYGAVGDGKTKDTAALQKAIAACGKAGGGTVLVPAGRYLTGPFTWVSSMELRLEKGATLLLSDSRDDFKLTNNRYEDAFTATNCHDIALTGEGTIDGQGADWWAHFDKRDTKAPHRPFLVVFTGCQRVLVKNVTLTRSPMFHLVPQRCQDVTIDGIHILSPEHAPNTDGIDPSGWRFHITRCVIDVGDDNIAVKPNGKITADQPAVKDFLIEDCTFVHGHGMSIGGQTPSGMNGMVVRNCTFKDTDSGIRLKASRGAGGLVENLTYENLTMQGVKVPILITSFYNGNSPVGGRVEPAQDPAQPVTETTPIWRHIRIRNVTATESRTAGQIFGLAEMPVEDVVLTKVKLAGRSGMQIVHAKGIRFEDSQVTAEKGAAVIVEDAQVEGIDRSGNPARTAKTTARVFRVTDYGAVGDGKTKNTEAIARAIEACVKAGGGRVEFPAGVYLTGPIALKSNLDLHVVAGATVQFSRDHADYPLIITHYEGKEAVRCQSPLWGENLENVSLTGTGTFDGGGETWRPVKKSKVPADVWQQFVGTGGYVNEATGMWWPSKAAEDGEVALSRMQTAGGKPRVADYLPYKDFLRPTLVELDGCKNVRLEGPTFRNSPAWDIHLLLSDDITVRGVTALNPWWAQNGDGIDIDSCRRVLVEHSTFDVGDDGICLKSGKDEEGRRLGRPTTDITIRNCTVYRAHGGVTIGSEMSGGVHNVTVTDCAFIGTDIGLRFKTTRGRGGVVENVNVRGVDMLDILGAAISFDMYYMVRDPTPEPVSERTPRFRQFTIRDITCEGAKSAVILRGLPEMPIEQITLDGVHIQSDTGVSLTDARDITFRNVKVKATGEPLQTERVVGLKMEAVEGLQEPGRALR